MRKIMISATIAALSLVAFAAPAFAGRMPDAATIRPAGLVDLATHYYGHKPKCFWKKVKKYDYYGNVIIKKIKVCH